MLLLILYALPRLERETQFAKILIFVLFLLIFVALPRLEFETDVLNIVILQCFLLFLMGSSLKPQAKIVDSATIFNTPGQKLSTVQQF